MPVDVPLWSAASASLVNTSRVGALPVALGLAGVGAARLGAISLPTAPPRNRALFGGLAACAAIVIAVRAMGAIGALSRGSLLGALFVVVVALVVARRDRRLGLAWRVMISRETAAIALVAALTVALAVLAANLLPVWQWDALGYHLPYVNFALQRGTFADVPADVPYISTYPHAIEHLFIAWRAMLSDDRLVDAAQIPLGVLGAGAVACLAKELGARADHAVAFGLLWLTLPAVFLQLPTNYIDVGCAALFLCGAAFTLAKPSASNVVAAGVALGLFLGAKPSAPIATLLMIAALGFRAIRARLGGALLVSIAIVFVLGADSYVANLVRHGNPIWPVRLTLGPIELPGPRTMQSLLDTGPEAPKLHGPVVLRVLRSWATLDAPPSFDMRYGGLWLFLAALPLAVVTAVRRRDLAIVLVLAGAIASPDPAQARYVLPLPGLVFAFAAATLSTMRPWSRRGALALAAVAAAACVARAYPGLTGEGPPLAAYSRMSEPERLRAVGADGPPARFYDALERLGPNDSTAFDASLDLPYLAWLPDLSKPAMRIPDDADRAVAERIVGDSHIRLLIVDSASLVAELARARGKQFTELFHCKSSTCVVLFRT